MNTRAWLLEPWRTRVLWLSLAGNFFLVALIGGHLVLRGVWHGRSGPPGLEGAVERMARDLPPADALQFRTVLDRERPWYEQARRRMDEARGEMARSMARTPYDEAEVRMRMQEFQARWMETSTRFGDSLLAALGTLSPEGRARLADATQRPRR